MKKKLISGLSVISVMLCLSGCCISHEWQDATCTAPQTCAKCGRTEGVPLGHTWADATCTIPKTCSECRETDGEPLGHGELTEANYQQGANCTVCGEDVGEPLTAAFETHGLTINAKENVTYDYVTSVSKDDPSTKTTGHLTFYNYHIVENMEYLENIDGYEWRSVHVNILFDGEYASQNPSFENYYDIEGWDDSSFLDESSGNRLYTVNYLGEDYPKCTYRSFNDRWSYFGNITTYDCDHYFRVPIGYDGAVISYLDYGNTWDDGMYIYDVADKNTLFFRLDDCEKTGNDIPVPHFVEYQDYIQARFIKSEEIYEFTTHCAETENSPKTTGTVAVTDYQTFAFDDTHEAKEGCEWKTVELQASFGDQNANNYDIFLSTLKSDYYYGSTFWYTLSEESDENGYYTFTIRWNGQEYAECKYRRTSEWNWQPDSAVWNYTCQWEFLTPAGYDGLFVGMADTIDCNNGAEYITANSLLFRLN